MNEQQATEFVELIGEEMAAMGMLNKQIPVRTVAKHLRSDRPGWAAKYETNAVLAVKIRHAWALAVTGDLPDWIEVQ